MSTRIDISIEYKERQVDFQIPTEISFGRLTELMHEALKKAKLPADWQLELKNKAIAIDETDLIKDLPIGNGEVFCIISNHEKRRM